MLLPSDVARLVLGYLEREGLWSTIRAFVLESPHLKEYGSHKHNNGAISACVFSLFGKNLTTILAEYVAAKFTETKQEIEAPAMMTSLWKKLDITLNKIKCLQSSLTLPEDQSCSKMAVSGWEARTLRMRNTGEPKSSKRRKMAHPLPLRNTRPCGGKAPPTTHKAPPPAAVAPAASFTPPRLALPPEPPGREPSQAMAGSEQDGGPEPSQAMAGSELDDGPEPSQAMAGSELDNGPEPSKAMAGSEQDDGPEPSQAMAGSEQDDGPSALCQAVSAVRSSPQTLRSAHSRSPRHGPQEGTRTTATASAPHPRIEPPQKQTADTGTVASSPDSGTAGGAVPPPSPPPSAPPSGSRPQSPRRMLCVEVSARNSSAPKLNLIGQCTSGPTFWWTKPPVPVSPRPPADTASEVGVEPLDGHRDGACRRGGPRRTGGGEDPAGPDPPVRKSHPAQREEETESGRGADRTRSAVRQGQRAAGRIGAVLGQGERTKSLEDPAHKGARLGDGDPGRPLSGTTASSGAHLRSPQPPSPVCPRQTTAMTTIPVRQGAQTLQHVGEQSPSEPLPLPRTPAPGPDPDRAAMLELQDPPDRAAMLELQVPPGNPPSVCSPGTNMAAHTLVILSRAIVSQAVTPPRRRDHQGAPHSCGGRKSLQHELLPHPASRSEPRLSANRSRVKRRKRLLHCFPDDLDVDKFLSSLHYDE